MATRQEIRDYFAKFGKEGGKATARNRTAEERSAAARKAVEARWKKAEELGESVRKKSEDLIQLTRTRKRNKKAK